MTSRSLVLTLAILQVSLKLSGYDHNAVTPLGQLAEFCLVCDFDFDFRFHSLSVSTFFHAVAELFLRFSHFNKPTIGHGRISVQR